MQIKFTVFLFVWVVLFLNACSKPTPIPGSILFLGHAYKSDTTIDPRLEQLDKTKYEHIWLGGDICAKSDNQRSTLEYINKHLGINQPGNYWALGNHDMSSGNYDWISAVTKKEEFYTADHNGMTVMVLNTNIKEPDCDRLNAQFEMFEKTCDTIQQSSHLILLSHHVIWGHVKGFPSLWERANANYPYFQSRCQPDSKFEHVLFPKLQEVQKRGVQVVFISGDYGQKEKYFQRQSEDGLWFIASGIDHTNRHMPDSLKETAKDRILYLQHDPKNQTLEWEFLNLDSLLERQ